MRVGFLTLGCKVNSYETEKMKIKFEEQGHTVVAFEEKADVYIVNTCTVTNIADRKSRKMLHRAKRRNPNSLVVAAGCYVDSSDKKGEKDSSVDLFVTNAMKEDLVAFVVEAMKERNIVPMQVMEEEFEKEHHMTKEAMAQKHTRAYLKVQNGCNQYCTYCIIPYVRGPLSSKPVEDVVYEVEQLAKDGIQEVVLTGIHLSSYGVDLTECKNFLELEGRMLLKLIRNVAKVDGIERIRLGSLEPRIITKNFLEELSQIPEVCPHFHLSLQSGCDQTLRRMNRHYSADEYEAGVKMIRAYFKHPAITTDIIVGFPQETEEEFEATCAFARRIAFAQIHVFKYSRRQGTMADAMTGQVDETIKNQRSEKLIGIEKELEKEYQKYFIGKKEEVLLEEVQLIEGREYVVGYNERYVRIAVSCTEMPDAKERCNTIATVKIERHLTDEILLGVYQ
ncbi:MAG: tRNA (N(6)-L-threonylcarbamoyladenosine(37)-C(2))-methylthiotransferase MtaB [Clostridiaceae bacterium]|nr:MAG: tRNA (N(6)-L-threonylcarbamoyladenosine(37)-C(2))-methylthiotransferase MtaB [Clostridiaceae bacterium]